MSRLDTLLVAGVGPSTPASWAMWIDSWGEAVRSPVLRKTWRQLDDRWRATLESVVHDGMEEGAFRQGDPAEDAAVIAVLIDGLGVQVALTSAKKASFLDQARRVTDTLLDVDPDTVNAERSPPPERLAPVAAGHHRHESVDVALLLGEHSGRERRMREPRCTDSTTARSCRFVRSQKSTAYDGSNSGASTASGANSH